MDTLLVAVTLFYALAVPASWQLDYGGFLLLPPWLNCRPKHPVGLPLLSPAPPKERGQVLFQVVFPDGHFLTGNSDRSYNPLPFPRPLTTHQE